jgi:hypothetical protein
VPETNQIQGYLLYFFFLSKVIIFIIITESVTKFRTLDLWKIVMAPFILCSIQSRQGDENIDHVGVGSKPAPSVHPGRLFFVTNLWLLLRSVPLGCAEPKPSNDKVSVFLSFVIPAKAHGRQVKVLYGTGIMVRE